MPTSTSASSAARWHSPSTSRCAAWKTSSIRWGWIRPSATSFSRVTRPISRRTGSKQESSTASGVSSTTRLTPVTDSKARMLRPSRPMMRPFISSEGRCSTLTTLSAVCSLATRWMASTTMCRARCSPVRRASRFQVAHQHRRLPLGLGLDRGRPARPGPPPRSVRRSAPDSLSRSSSASTRAACCSASAVPCGGQLRLHRPDLLLPLGQPVGLLREPPLALIQPPLPALGSRRRARGRRRSAARSPARRCAGPPP